MAFSLEHKKALSITPHVTGFMSMVGSALIARSVFLDMRTKTACTYHRILLGMSLLDFLTSFWMGLSTWPMPKGTPGVFAPSGNTTTCAVQGFFVQMLVGVPLYNASLAIYYLLTSRFNWSEAKILSVEPLMHLIPWSFSIGTATAGLPMKLYNNANLWCWIASFPAGCKDSYTYGEQATCTRGDNAVIFRWTFMLGPVWICTLTSMVSLTLVYCTVLQKERDIDKFQQDGVSSRKQSKRVAWQAFWYIMAFYLTCVPPTVTRLLQTIPSTKGKLPFGLTYTFSFLLPLQGFFNSLIFFRAKFIKYRRENPGASPAESLAKAILSTPKVTTGFETMTDPGLPDIPNDAPAVQDVTLQETDDAQPSD